MLESFWKKIEEWPMSLTGWIISFAGIVAVRLFLENFSNLAQEGLVLSDTKTLVHIGLFFLLAALGFIVIIGKSTKDYLSAAKVVLCLWPLVWLAPILDILISKGIGSNMSYIYETGNNLLSAFVKLLTLQNIPGLTYGIQIEVLILFALFGLYVWFKRKKIWIALGSIFLLVLFLFFIASIPSLLYSVTHLQNAAGTAENIWQYINHLSVTSNIYGNALADNSAVLLNPLKLTELGLDTLMSQVLLILSAGLTLFILWKIDKKTFKAIAANARIERVLFWFLLFALGLGYAILQGSNFLSWVDAFGLLCIAIAGMNIWMYSISINDIIDVNIDIISNPERPLVQKTVTEKSMRDISGLFLTFALLGLWSVGFLHFFFGLVCIATSYIYSMPPMRFKQLPILSTFLLSIAGLCTILIGFFFLSSDKNIEAFPPLAALGILIAFTLEANFKDLKDVEGDKKEGIKTLPVLFPKNGDRVVGLLFALSLLLLPIFLSFYTLYLTAIPAALLGYRYIVKKPYKEKRVFAVHFGFLGSLVILVLILNFLGCYLGVQCLI